MEPDQHPPESSNLTNNASNAESVTEPSALSSSPATNQAGHHTAGQEPSQPQRQPAGRRKESISDSNDPTARGELSPGATDRVFPIRSVISVDPNSTPAPRQFQPEGYFYNSARASDARRQSSSTDSSSRQASRNDPAETPRAEVPGPNMVRRETRRQYLPRLPPQVFSDIVSSRSESEQTGEHSERPPSTSGAEASSVRSVPSDRSEDGGIVTARFKHIVTAEGHAVITGRDGDVLQRCEDEPIHIPGAVQGFGLLIALQEEDGKFVVRIVSENSKSIIGYSPKQLFALDSFTDILSEEQADNLLDHIDFIRDEDADVATNGPEVFTISIRTPRKKSNKLWCAMHVNDRNPGLVICEFELEDDQLNPLIPPSDLTPDVPENTLNSNPTPEEYLESTQNVSRPLRVLRSARKRKGEAAAMEVFNIMSQVQEQLAAAPNLEKFLKILVGVVKELTGFHRVMVYQFDQAWNGRVVTELVDPRATKDLFNGLNFPASDIPKQARDLYKINRVRLLYDRDQETARLVCRTLDDLEDPLDLTYSYLRAMSPIHLKYLANMAVRSSMSISINAFNELWGLIACHSYGPKGMRVSFPIRKMCRLVGDSASRNIERLSYASRLQARKLINTVPTQHNPSGYIIASSEDLLKLFGADFGLVSIQDETKILGHLENSQEALALLEYLRMRRLTSVISSQDITQDFPDLRYPPGFSVIAGMLVVPLSVGGNDFIVFFRKGQLREVKWAGNPYDKYVKEGTEGYLEPRKSFKTWCETVVGKSREWTEEEIETAAVLCLVYGKFIEVWRQKEAALQNSQLTKLLLANSAHEVRTPLNAIINYLEIALEGTLDQETRENLAKSHSASKSLIYVINDLLDLTKTEEGGELIKGEKFDLAATLTEATDPFASDAKRKGIDYTVVKHPGVPQNVIGDQRRVRQAISNICANAIQHTSKGGIQVEMYVASRESNRVDVEVAVEDTGAGMNSKKLDSLFRELEQVQSEPENLFDDVPSTDTKQISDGSDENKRTLGLGLAVVARIIRNMDGQLRLKSEEGKGSRFVIQFPFDLPDGEGTPPATEGSELGSTTPQAEPKEGEVTLVQRGRERRTSVGSPELQRKDSTGSVNSKRSLRSIGSGLSGRSAKSDVDRLIEAIQEPHVLEDHKRPSIGERSLTGHSHGRPKFEKRVSYGSGPVSPARHRTRSLEQSEAGTPERTSLDMPNTPGQEQVPYSGTPIKAVKVSDGVGSPVVPKSLRKKPSGSVIGEVDDKTEKEIKRESCAARAPSKERAGSPEQQPLSADHLRVLVAEDDPVNSKIVKKRMERFGHEVFLTGNGEECATAYGDECDKFDVVLMDMQMPIVDGLTSTKMIRSYEKTHPESQLSQRATLNGRVPIIAVSASLVEKEKQTYVDAGFDGWILKPISFPRLNNIMEGIVDADTRRDALYTPGNWEKGGWFEMPLPEQHASIEGKGNTQPDDDKTPTASPSPQANAATMVDGLEHTPDGGRTPDDKLDSNEQKTEKSYSAPQLGLRGFPPEADDDIRKHISFKGEGSAPTPESVDQSPPAAE